MFIFCVPAGGDAETFGGEAHQEPIGCRQAPKQTPVKRKSKQSNAFAKDTLLGAGKLWLWVPFIEPFYSTRTVSVLMIK